MQLGKWDRALLQINTKQYEGQNEHLHTSTAGQMKPAHVATWKILYLMNRPLYVLSFGSSAGLLTGATQTRARKTEPLLI